MLDLLAALEPVMSDEVRIWQERDRVSDTRYLASHRVPAAEVLSTMFIESPTYPEVVYCEVSGDALAQFKSTHPNY